MPFRESLPDFAIAVLQRILERLRPIASSDVRSKCRVGMPRVNLDLLLKRMEES